MGQLELPEGVDRQFLEIAVLEDLQLGHARADDPAVLFFLKHDNYLQQGGLQSPDVLLEGAVVLAVVDAVAGRVGAEIGVGLIEKHLREFD